MARSHLEHAGVLWNPYRKGNIKCLEKVQVRATKLVNRVKHWGYEDWLKSCCDLEHELELELDASVNQ